MTKKILLVLAATVIGFVLGVVGLKNYYQGETLGAVEHGPSKLVGDVYNGLAEVLMMRNGEFVGPIDTDDAASLLGGVNYTQSIETIAADNTIAVSESGKTFYLATTGATSTLPSVASSTGATFRFVIGATFTGPNFTISSAEGDNIEGALIVAGAVVNCDAVDIISFVADGENLGDFVELTSNGTNWYIGASGGLTSAKMTCSG